MNRLPFNKRVQVVRCLVEGSSIRSTVRITGVAKNTILKLLVDLGNACAEYQNQTLVNLSCDNLQVDEIWSFVYAKKKNVPDKFKNQFGYGDAWTFTAIDAKTKLVPCWLVGPRDSITASIFMKDLASRLTSRVQLTTDGHKMYARAVDDGFGTDVDYAMLVKIYGQPTDGPHRYSPPECIDAIRIDITGKPNPKLISTSYVERQNLTMRMSMRRFTRLTNAFSKKVENLAAAVSLHFMHYNFSKIHQTLRCSPAMEAGVTDRLWSVEDIVALI